MGLQLPRILKCRYYKQLKFLKDESSMQYDGHFSCTGLHVCHLMDVIEGGNAKRKNLN